MPLCVLGLALPGDWPCSYPWGRGGSCAAGPAPPKPAPFLVRLVCWHEALFWHLTLPSFPVQGSVVQGQLWRQCAVWVLTLLAPRRGGKGLHCLRWVVNMTGALACVGLGLGRGQTALAV